MIEIARLSSLELLALHARIGEELRHRGVARTSNNPTGELAEYLFCAAFGWNPTGNSSANVDATAGNGTRYQIKGRRITRHNKSRQLSAIRGLEGRHFEFLAAVLFAEDYAVLRAALVPFAVVERRAKYLAYTNSHKFILRDDVWSERGVYDATKRLVEASSRLEATGGSL